MHYLYPLNAVLEISAPNIASMPHYYNVPFISYIEGCSIFLSPRSIQMQKVGSSKAQSDQLYCVLSLIMT